ncbi:MULTISPECIES: AfsR/SARP family transcriptional regulator [Streptomyces]|uniref:AfsR/SARP family transcriptional regulator n=2 Tax=Streptomyces TaxID=1883 RepID=A0A939JP39_9ACTN|nr:MULTISPECIES: AfsR/SARP family transcriptional regulator [Streptomyces]MBO0651825.1 AfsR/SARP family transcriptional regulator [Streptomyces triculaminicus]QSY47250.1 AfsR/SARP family transcriptional regulator [Streptomyces griseocarneus]
MQIEVLGPIAARVNGTSIVPTAGKPRQILALLAIRAGRVVAVETLMTEVWGDAIPRSAATTLQTYILQLRRKISEAGPQEDGRTAKDILATCYGGYQLNPMEYSCDLLEFQQLVRRGSRAMGENDPATATAELSRALELWRGPALVDVPVGEVLGMEIIGMQEERTRALELRIEADLQLGRHAELIGELRMLVAQQPMHEALCAQLMTALYRAGHPWRALDAFQSLRRALVEELGVEPSPRLQRLHQAVLANDERLEVPAPTHALLTA